MKSRILLFISLFLLVFGVNAQTAAAEYSRVTVLQTGDSAGHLFACLT